MLKILNYKMYHFIGELKLSNNSVAILEQNNTITEINNPMDVFNN